MADVEQFYLIDKAGQACGAGDREELELDGGDAGEITKVLDTTGDSWNFSPVAQKFIPPGNWKVSFRLEVSGGLGTPEVEIIVRRMTSGCSEQETIFSEVVTVVASATDTYVTTPTDPGAITFAAGEILLVEVKANATSHTKTLHYDDESPSANRSFLEHPGQGGLSLEYQSPAAPPIFGTPEVVSY